MYVNLRRERALAHAGAGVFNRVSKIWSRTRFVHAYPRTHARIHTPRESVYVYTGANVYIRVKALGVPPRERRRSVAERRGIYTVNATSRSRDRDEVRGFEEVFSTWCAVTSFLLEPSTPQVAYIQPIVEQSTLVAV